VGQVVLHLLLGHPPKQRAMPLESRLQTAFWPLQQFCEALSPSAPQMFPGGLHDVPLVQRSVPGVHWTP
jgi:hypothetical protein